MVYNKVMTNRKYFNNWRQRTRQHLIEKGLCSECGEKPLATKWRCRPCADKMNQYAMNHYYKNHKENKIKHLKHSHNYRFGGLRGKVLERDHHQCQICKYSKKIIVHHINENPKDNRLDNLVVLCQICHVVVERINANKPNMKFICPSIRQRALP